MPKPITDDGNIIAFGLFVGTYLVNQNPRLSYVTFGTEFFGPVLCKHAVYAQHMYYLFSLQVINPKTREFIG